MIDISNLSNEERLSLIERLWDSLSAKPDEIPITQDQRDELDHRLADMDRDGGRGIAADVVLDRLGAKQH